MRRLWVVLSVATVGRTVLAGADMVGVQPAFVSVASKAGTTLKRSLELFNSSGSSLQFEMQVKDWGRSGGEEQLGSIGTLGTPTAGPWLSVYPRLVTVSSKGTEKVEVVLNVPANARGGYYAAVTVTSVPPKGGAKGRVNVVNRVGIIVPVLVAIGGTPKIEITDVRCAPAEQTVSCAVTARNKGDVHAVAWGSVLLMDKAGGVAANMELRPRTWLPGEERTLEAMWLAPIDAGRYESIVSLKVEPAGAGGAVASRTIDLAAPPRE